MKHISVIKMIVACMAIVTCTHITHTREKKEYTLYKIDFLHTIYVPVVLPGVVLARGYRLEVPVTQLFNQPIAPVEPREEGLLLPSQTGFSFNEKNTFRQQEVVLIPNENESWSLGVVLNQGKDGRYFVQANAVDVYQRPTILIGKMPPSSAFFKMKQERPKLPTLAYPRSEQKKETVPLAVKMLQALERVSPKSAHEFRKFLEKRIPVANVAGLGSSDLLMFYLDWQVGKKLKNYNSTHSVNIYPEFNMPLNVAGRQEGRFDGERFTRIELEKATANYKIHLMPKEKDALAVIDLLFNLIETNEGIRNRITEMKINKNVAMTEKATGRILGIIVIYPVSTKEDTQIVLNALCSLYKDWQGLGVSPLYNKRVSSLIYYSQGDGDIKDTADEHAKINYLRYFEDDYVHFRSMNKIPGEYHLDLKVCNKVLSKEALR